MTTGIWLLTTGGYKKANVYNIYDLGGNLWEWTMEGAGVGTRVVRGGSIVNGDSVIARNTPNPYGGLDSTLGNKFTGFRPSLYIK